MKKRLSLLLPLPLLRVAACWFLAVWNHQNGAMAPVSVSVSALLLSLPQSHHYYYKHHHLSSLSSPSQLHSTATDSSSATAASTTVVEFIDPVTHAEVVLVGVFHGTKSSAQDVQCVMRRSSKSRSSTSSSSSSSSSKEVVVLELCASRFADLQRQQEQEKQQEEQQQQDQSNETTSAAQSFSKQKLKPKSWAERYTIMILQTVQQRGIATGVAAAVLAGFSGLQSAMSGFTPGLEFLTALEECQNKNNNNENNNTIDILLADQDVDETLRKLGDWPGTASTVFVWEEERMQDGRRQRRSLRSIGNECLLHAATLQQAIVGCRNHHNNNNNNDNMLDNNDGIIIVIPQVHLPSALLRNKSAITDLARLALPTVLLTTLFSQTMAVAAMGTTPEISPPLSSLSSLWMIDTLITTETVQEWMIHFLTSSAILGLGTLATVPVVKTILTERDEILTTGIQEGALLQNCVKTRHVDGLAC